MHNKKRLILFFIVIGYVLFVGFEVLYEHGEVWCTKKNGYGCVCHEPQASPDVHVRVEGPTTIRLGDSAFYRIYVSGGPALAAGFNVAAGHGILSPADTSSYVLDSELTHSSPSEFESDTVVSWQFVFMGTTVGLDTIFSVGNSVNRNSEPSGDRWNYGENFAITVQEPLSVEQQRSSPRSFALLQNYPNPFNPKTTLSFVIRHSSFVTLKVYSMLGKEIATLVNEQTPIGEYTVEWNAEGQPSGIYFYRLCAGNFVDTKKMIIMK
jgi:hypothetical protein